MVTPVCRMWLKTQMFLIVSRWLWKKSFLPSVVGSFCRMLYSSNTEEQLSANLGFVVCGLVC
jgi:hypothetical protein